MTHELCCLLSIRSYNLCNLVDNGDACMLTTSLLASWKCKGKNCCITMTVQHKVFQWQESMRKQHKLLSADLRKGIENAVAVHILLKNNYFGCTGGR